MARPASLTRDAQYQLALDWQAGVPAPELCRRFAISNPTLYAYRRRLNLPKRGRGGWPVRPPRVAQPKPKRAEPADFPFTWFPPRIVRGKRWRCPCGNQSDRGPQCVKCQHEEAA